MTVNTELGKITASKEVLNRLSIALSSAADSIQAKRGVESATYSDTTPPHMKYSMP